MRLTEHARVRAQKRSIPPLIVDWLFGFGARERAGDGAEVLFFDKRARRELEKTVGKQVVGRLSPMLDAYLVVHESSVVTAGWRYKRVRHS